MRPTLLTRPVLVPEPVCGHTVTGPTGIRWVCVRPPHSRDDPVPPGTNRDFWSPESHRYVRHQVQP